MYRKTLCIVLTLIMLISAFPFSAAAAASDQLPSSIIAHDWAKPEIQRAIDLGLVSNQIKSKDLTQLITREEFCQLAVILYEKYTGRIVEPCSDTEFYDTRNLYILKAYALEIANGTSFRIFSPNSPISREQAAAILFRTIKRMKPLSDYNVEDMHFADQEDISEYAIQAAKYMAKLEIIKGDTNGNFMPNDKNAKQSAVYGKTTREAAILMSVRIFEKLDTIEITAKELSALPSMVDDFQSNPHLSLFPYGTESSEGPADIDNQIMELIAKVENVPEEIVDDLKISIKALAIHNPVYTPEQVIKMFSGSFKGVLDYQSNLMAAFSSDGYLYLRQDALEQEQLSWILAHELTHSLQFSKKSNLVFYYRIEDIQGREWSFRIGEGMTTLYAFSAMGGEYATDNQKYQIKFNSYIADQHGTYQLEQTSAILFCNSLGRELVANAYYGEKEDSNLLMDYYEALTGRSFQEFLGAAEEFVAYSYNYTGPNIESANKAGKKYMDLVLEILDKRRTVASLDDMASEIDALIALSPSIYDDDYMNYYFNRLKELRASVTATN